MSNKNQSLMRNVSKIKIHRRNISQFYSLSNGSILSSVRMSDNSFGYVLKRSNYLIGFVVVDQLRNGDREVTELVVDAKYKRKGYGGILLQAAKSLGANIANVDQKNPEALHLFLTKGFHVYRSMNGVYFMTTKKSLPKIPVSDRYEKKKLLKESAEIDECIAIERYQNDLALNLNEFEIGNYNFLLVVGLPGSGKGTFGRKLSEEYGAIHLELDIFDQCGNMKESEIRKYGEPFTSYILEDENGIWYWKNAKTLSVNEKIQGNHDFIRYVIDYCKVHPENLYVIDGTPIYASMTPDEIYQYPIIIKGTSAIDSFMHKVNRDLGKKQDHLHSNVSEEYLDGLRSYYKNDEQDFQNWIKSVIEKIKENDALLTIQEKAMSAKERNRLSEEDFGIPELRKYPLHDKLHVVQAIKMFNHVDREHEKELAINIFRAMKKFNLSTSMIGERNRLIEYLYLID